MTHSIIHRPDPKLDLAFERIVDVSRELVWKAWTMPELLKQWFTPAPWKTIECEIDLRPGGVFRTVMRSPEGQELLNVGCYLEIVENEKLVWTNALAPGYRPCKAPEAISSCGTFFFTAVIALEPQGNATRYTALVLHSEEEARKKHEEMGFHEGWGKALDQLIEVVKQT